MCPASTRAVRDIRAARSELSSSCRASHVVTYEMNGSTQRKVPEKEGGTCSACLSLGAVHRAETLAITDCFGSISWPMVASDFRIRHFDCRLRENKEPWYLKQLMRLSSDYYCKSSPSRSSHGGFPKSTGPSNVRRVHPHENCNAYTSIWSTPTEEPCSHCRDSYNRTPAHQASFPPLTSPLRTPAFPCSIKISSSLFCTGSLKRGSLVLVKRPF